MKQSFINSIGESDSAYFRFADYKVITNLFEVFQIQIIKLACPKFFIMTVSLPASLSVSLFVRMVVCLPASLSVSVFVRMVVCLPASLSVSLFVRTCLPCCQPVCLSERVRLPASLSVCQNEFACLPSCQSVYLSEWVHLPASLSIFLLVKTTVCLPACQSLYCQNGSDCLPANQPFLLVRTTVCLPASLPVFQNKSTFLPACLFVSITLLPVLRSWQHFFRLIHRKKRKVRKGGEGGGKGVRRGEGGEGGEGVGGRAVWVPQAGGKSNNESNMSTTRLQRTENLRKPYGKWLTFIFIGIFSST